jgi:small subunit ribosomal protein S21
MIKIDVLKYKSLDQALKFYKNKHNKIGIVKELRERQEFEKPSVTRRKQKLKAVYKEKFINKPD